MLSREIRLEIVKQIKKLSVASIKNDMKENTIQDSLSNICIKNYFQLYTVKFCVQEFFNDALIICKLDEKFYDTPEIRNEIIKFFVLDVNYLMIYCNLFTLYVL